MRFFIVFLTILTLTLPVYASAPDLSISAGNVRFSEEVLYAGETVRLYATVKNYSDVDVSAKVIFYQGALLIGSSQTVSVLAEGGSDDVYVDYEVPHGTFNIRAVIQGQSPEDINAANDEAITGLFTAVSDADRDGIMDEEDNCPNDGNEDQADADGDGVGNTCDEDRDGDGVKNDEDAYPSDASKSGDSEPVVEEIIEETSEPEVFEEMESISSDADLPQSETNDTGIEPSPSTSEGIQKAPMVTETQAPQPYPGIFGFGTLSISPYAQFSYRQIDWRTYEFTALESEGQGSVTYSWDFGDGATSVQSSLVHAFPDAGQYVVTLAVTDEAGVMVSDAETFDISFFHLHNPWIQATLAALFFILLGLVWVLVRMKEAKEEKEEV
jgi:hypothetical protein